MSLIERIMNKFSSQANASCEQPTRSAISSLLGQHDATNSTVETLTHLSNSRQLLEIQIHNRESSFQSMIIAVDIERGLLWLDQLVPHTLALSEGQWLTMRHQRMGHVLTLKVPVISDQTSTRGAIAVLLPNEAIYRPRRHYARFETDGETLNAKVRTIGAEPTQVRVLNVSGGGLRIALKGNQLRHYHRDAHLPLCQFSLSGHLKINCQARVKSARLVREPFRHTQVSLEFTDIALGACKQLDQQLKLLHAGAALDQTGEQLQVNDLQLAG
ncbi:flagellar brake protein [Gilvimarinus sp. SDUM040013]|uniref:Flagellar brake protein n=1 Tax=Gilvimarinus gilvus TaxID=3058038 RepID=A0ABU4RUB8_9GAMM|nr:flagellar brake protein [Gilvimarinus sp. SDUM040013]MDO3385095.1 flagellar brake protein [Gilvimarinus sp. SDUM040013]MDX6848470.1 flagellar brake protein [Gilvimarinus sp. SDUM040013]